MYIGLLLSALNKLPLKLPGNSAGRRHVQKSSTSEPVTFDDVAGVDEAKEELAEVVVCPLLGAVVVSSWLTWHNAWLWPSQLDAADRHGAFLYAKTSMTFDVSQKVQDSLPEHPGPLLQAM